MSSENAVNHYWFNCTTCLCLELPGSELDYTIQKRH
jgi:hypothetical protein